MCCMWVLHVGANVDPVYQPQGIQSVVQKLYVNAHVVHVEDQVMQIMEHLLVHPHTAVHAAFQEVELSNWRVGSQ